MEEYSKSTENNIVEQKINIQIITFCTIIIVLILTFISFIHIYAGKRDEVIKDLENESIHLETLISDYLDHSGFFISLIGRHIKSDPKNINHINKIFKDHFESEDSNQRFGWRKYSWVDDNYKEIVTSTQGIMQSPRLVGYVKKQIANSYTEKSNKNSIWFYNQKYDDKSSNLKIVNNLFSDQKKFVGSVVLSYDIKTMVDTLNSRKKNEKTNFIILKKNELLEGNKDYEIVAKSQKQFFYILENKQESALKARENVLKKIKRLKVKDKHLDMISGANYHISRLENLPFIIIVSIDSNIIREDIINDLAKSFILVCIFAMLSMFTIIFIYKRETYLRTKSEKALIMVKNANKTKTSFLAFTAHEIRSPLGFILTGSEVMKKGLFGKMPEAYTNYVNGINKNAKLILDFITDILDENQIVEGHFKIVNTTSNLSDLVQEAIQINKARFDKRKVNIKEQIADDLPMLICDNRRMVQILNNLISNSIKYSKDGTTITISAEIIDKCLHINVADEGIGMNEEEIPLALSAYGMLRDGNYQKTGSYGLGLAIVKMLLEAHDAKFYISSVKNKGTDIKMIFPKYKLMYKNKNVRKK